MKERVDKLLVERGLAPSRTRARALIEAGKVTSDGATIARPSELLALSCTLAVSELDHPFVSRGGLKLDGALDDLGLAVTALVVADIGASTGGFTDCVLRRGAARVYAIDVGHGQLHPSLQTDPRVIIRIGDGGYHLEPGQAYEINNLLVHAVTNDSDVDRIHLIVDFLESGDHPPPQADLTS